MMMTTTTMMMMELFLDVYEPICGSGVCVVS